MQRACACSRRFSTSSVETLPYRRGSILPDTAADVEKLRVAWRVVERRAADGSLFNFTGLERSLVLPAAQPALLDDDVAPALVGDRLRDLALEHLGGDAERHDVFVANRLTAATVAAMQVLVPPGGTVVGVSPSYSHPSVARAVRLAGGTFHEGRAGDPDGWPREPDVVVVTRLAVTYELLDHDAVEETVAAARERRATIYVDDAGGARVAPALLDQPRTLELDADVGATGLDKYGTTGPRLGLLAGRADLVGRIRARAIELGLEARPMLFPAVVHSLEAYSADRVRALVAATQEVGDALVERLGSWITRTPVAVRLEGEEILEEAHRRGAPVAEEIAPIEATAALAMLLLRDHGILTVHFAALPPGTSALLLKFVSPETLLRFGGAARFADAVDSSIDELARVLAAPEDLRRLLRL